MSKEPVSARKQLLSPKPVSTQYASDIASTSSFQNLFAGLTLEVGTEVSLPSTTVAENKASSDTVSGRLRRIHTAAGSAGHSYEDESSSTSEDSDSPYFGKQDDSVTSITRKAVCACTLM